MSKEDQNVTLARLRAIVGEKIPSDATPEQEATKALEAFDESKVKRDEEGKFAEKAGGVRFPQDKRWLSKANRKAILSGMEHLAGHKDVHWFANYPSGNPEREVFTREFHRFVTTGRANDPKVQAILETLSKRKKISRESYVTEALPRVEIRKRKKILEIVMRTERNAKRAIDNYRDRVTQTISQQGSETGNLEVQQLRPLRVQVRAEVGRMARNVLDEAQQGVRQVIMAQYEDMDDRLRTLTGEKLFDRLMAGRARDFSQAAVGFMRGEFGNVPLEDLAMNLANDEYRLLNSMLTRGVARKLPLGKLIKDVKAKFKGKTLRQIKGERPLGPGPGVYRSAYRNAERIVRTELSAASNAAMIEWGRGKDFVTGYTFRLSAAHPKPDECDEYEGQFFAKDDPRIDGLIPLHPNCLCWWTPEFDTSQAQEALKGEFDESKHVRDPEGRFREKPMTLLPSNDPLQGYVQLDKSGNVKVSGITGKQVAPFELPSGIPRAKQPARELFIESLFGRKWYVDLEAFRAYELKTDKATGAILRAGTSSAELTPPNPVKTLSEKIAGSGAWASKMGLSLSKGAGFDEQLSAAHKAEDVVQSFEKAAKEIESPISSPTIERAMFVSARLEAEAMKEPLQLPSTDYMLGRVSTTKPDLIRRQIETVRKRLDGKTRLEAMAELGLEEARIEKRQARAYNQVQSKDEEILKDESRHGEIEGLWKKFWDRPIHSQVDAIRAVRQGVIKDLTDRLVPSYPEGSFGSVAMAGITASPDVEPEDAARVRGGTERAWRWLGRSLHPSTVKAMAESRPEVEIKSASDKYNRANYTSGRISLRPESDAGVAVHEYGHHLGQRTDADSFGMEFVEKRALPGYVPLRRLTGIGDYREDEVAKPDRFTSSYVGKHYEGGHTEVISIGVESVFRDPVDFYRQDREHFLLTVFVMRGGANRRKL